MCPETMKPRLTFSISSTICGSYRSSLAMELMVGARNQQEVSEIDQLVTAYSVIPLAAEIGNSAYRLLKRHAKSHGLRVFDSLIAATALDEDLTLVTKNKKHFQMIDSLKLEVPSY